MTTGPYDEIPDVTASPSRNVQVRYSEEKAHEIADLYAEGRSLYEISSMPGMPAQNTLYNWVRHNESFRQLLNDTRAARAFAAEDEIMLIARQGGINKDDVGGERLKFDAYKWLAEVNDPGRYGKKTTISGDKNNPVVLIVNTGVPEPSTPQTTLSADGIVIKDVESEVVPAAEAEFTDV